MKINILGSEWTIVERSETEDDNLKSADGYTDWTTRTIVIERWITGTLGNMESYIRKVKRHEITHAFLEESGLGECTAATDAWARNEEMVDWLARIGPKLYEAWRAADAL